MVTHPRRTPCLELCRLSPLVAALGRVARPRARAIPALMVLAAVTLSTRAPGSGLDSGLPDSLHVQGRLALPDYALAVAAQGSYAYVANGHGGFTAVDVSDPTSPVTVANIPLDGFAQAVVLEGAHVFVADDQAGVRAMSGSKSTTRRAVSCAASSMPPRGRVSARWSEMRAMTRATTFRPASILRASSAAGGAGRPG
jgi:hypothetical protein